MKRFLSMLWLVLLSACAQTTPPATGSQTHFLVSCDGDDGCAAPYSCLCGVCTRQCTSDTVCESESELAACVDVAADSCSAAKRTCDVECTDDVDCKPLGGDYACSEGRCRAAAPTMTDGSDAGMSMDLGELCDGSDNIRLGLTSGGGAVDSYYEVTNPYGYAFFFVDGHCNYYASQDFRDGFFRGTLSPARSELLATAVHWSSLPDLGAEPETMSCPDAGATSINAPNLVATCTCGCDPGPLSKQKEQAIGQAYTWVEMLVDSGERVDAGVVMVAEIYGDALGDETVWPLDRPITEIAGLTQSMSVGVRFDDPKDIAPLRALFDLRSRVVLVQDDGLLYKLHIRDGLPAGVPEAIMSLLQSAPQEHF